MVKRAALNRPSFARCGATHRPMMFKAQAFQSKKLQRGQSLVFVIALTVPMMLATLMLYKTGKLTSEKMELQNAADAVAFSISTLEARDLNFASYMNRAMVANEVGIGQMVGLRSWANHYTSYGGFIHAIGTTIGAIPFPPLRVVPKVTKKIKEFFDKTGDALERGSEAIAKIVIPITSTLNKALGGAEGVYHLATAYTIVESLVGSDSLIQKNAPGAELSNFSKLSIMVHLGSFLGKYAKYYSPTQEKHKEGFSRLASIIRESRDPFSVSRTPDKPINLYLLPPRIGASTVPSPLRIVNIDVGTCAIVCFTLQLSVRLGMRIDHLGGSELRFKVKQNEPTAFGKDYNWTAADVSEARLDFNLSGRLRFEVLGVGPDVSFSTPPLPGVPLGAGFAQAASKPANKLSTADLIKTSTDGPGADYSDEALELLSYGGAPSLTLPWNIGTFVPLTKPVVRRQANALTGYQGLPFYIGVAGRDEVDQLKKFQILAPYVLIGLVKNVGFEAGNGNTVFGANSPRPSGPMRLVGDGENEAADDQIAAIAKAEVYFKRSSDLSTFARGDGKEEYGSTFNPYWQAKLVNTSEVDRMISLLTQQEVIWLSGISTVQTDFVNLVNSVAETFDTMVDGF